MRLYFQVLLLFICVPSWVQGICSSVYGAKPCPFIPSPPGETPPCAKPGLTYCEYPAHYPRELVHNLLERWKFDHRSLLLDENQHEIGNFYFSSDSKYTFGSYGSTQNNIQPNQGYFTDVSKGHDTHNAYTINSYTFPSNTYIPSRINYTQVQQDGYKYPKNYYTPNYNTNNEQQYYKSVSLADLTKHPLNRFIKWHGRNDKYYKRKRRSLNKLSIWYNNSNNTKSVSRKKRQENLIGQTLCQSRSQYIMPRAALNNKGDWMYVVNIPEVNNKYTQLVKSEICTSQQCNGICSLPNGYTSRCEQKYVQKRLVAVEPGGSNLYSDVFWFPSCCICTINNN